MSILEKATIKDFDAVVAFYDDIIDHTPGIERYARWSKGAHPTSEGLRAFIQEGSLYLYREAVALARAQGMKSLRLDTLASNTPAQRLYQSLGFEFRGKQYLYAENTAWTDFFFYEYKNEL